MLSGRGPSSYCTLIPIATWVRQNQKTVGVSLILSVGLNEKLVFKTSRKKPAETLPKFQKLGTSFQTLMLFTHSKVGKLEMF